MLGSTAPLSIWGKFSMGCYLSEYPDEPVYLAVGGVLGPDGPTGINGRDNILGLTFSQPKKIMVDFYCSEIFGMKYDCVK